MCDSLLIRFVFVCVSTAELCVLLLWGSTSCMSMCWWGEIVEGYVTAGLCALDLQ